MCLAKRFPRVPRMPHHHLTQKKHPTGYTRNTVLIRYFIFFIRFFFPAVFEKDVCSIASYNPTGKLRIEALRRQLFAKYFHIIS